MCGLATDRSWTSRSLGGSSILGRRSLVTQARCKRVVVGMRHGRFDPCPSHVTDKDVDLSSEVPTAQGLTRLTVNLNVEGKGALLLATQISKLSQTDVVNKALLVYAMVVLTEEGGVEYVAKKDDGEERVEFSKM